MNIACHGNTVDESRAVCPTGRLQSAFSIVQDAFIVKNEKGLADVSAPYEHD
jgi:hypothetical protein